MFDACLRSAKRLGRPVSRLCHADKMVFLIEPAWLYLPRVRATGELAEFMAAGAAAARTSEPYLAAETADLLSGSAWRWHCAVRHYMSRWLAEHKDGAADTWTRQRNLSVLKSLS